MEATEAVEIVYPLGHPYKPTGPKLGYVCRVCEKPEREHAPKGVNIALKRYTVEDFAELLAEIRSTGKRAEVRLVIADADGDGDQDVTLVVNGKALASIDLGGFVERMKALAAKAIAAVKRAVTRKPKAKAGKAKAK